MRRLFLYSLSSTFAIIGSIIGAGFVTGKEVFEFFAKDLSIGGVYLAFLGFAFAIYFVMCMNGNSSYKWFEIFVSIASIVVAGCMISALDLVYKRLFTGLKNVKIISIVTAILLFYMSFGGICSVEKFCVFILPIVTVILISLCVIRIEDYSMAISPNSAMGIYKPFVYVGFNVVLSAGVIKNSGEKLSPLFKIISSLLTSFIIVACILLISLAVKDEGSCSEMPFISLFSNNIKLLKIIDIITLFAIYSTLISSLYTINHFGGIRLVLPMKILLFVVAVIISYIGFGQIVERLYFALGALAYVLIIISFLLSKSFQVKRQVHTSSLLKCRE